MYEFAAFTLECSHLSSNFKLAKYQNHSFANSISLEGVDSKNIIIMIEY